MRRSSLYNAAIFSAVLVAALCLIALVYYRMRRKDIAIARALGVPIRRCAAQAALPLALAGLLSAVPGGALGWRYTLDNAGAILRALDEFGGGGAASLSVWWLAALWGTVLALLLAAAVGGGLFLSARPVLELPQGGGAAREKRLAAQAEAGARSVPLPASAAPAAARQRDAALPTTERPGVGYVLRFIWRHIARSRLKSALAAVLAAGFTVGLAAIQLSITGSQAEIDWLYENTTVEAELVLERSGQSLRGSGFLRRDVIDRLMETGYVTRAYLEGSASGAVVRYTPALEAQGAGHITDEEQIRKTVRAFDDESVFLTPAGSGGGVAITYLDGWDGSLFSRDWDGGERIPLVLPKAVYDECGHGPDRAVGLVCKSFRVCEVAGYYEGNVAGEAGETDPILLPLSAYQMMCGSRMTTYTKAHVTLDPSLNRELEQFQRALLAAAAGQSGMLALRAVMWDEELRLAVAPLENSIQLMRVLYPVTLVLSLLAAAGIAALFVMTSAREAAILRILGTSRLRSRVMLALQTVFASLGGLLAGLAAALACAQRAGPALTAGLAGTSVLCAVLYLLAAVLGAAASAVSITNKNPLELLQARE